jgi:short-subunit dehydrogenase
MTSSPWALITGASSSIGECFARALVARGRNLVLVARSVAKPQELASGLASSCNVRAEPISLDLSEPGAAARLASTLRERELAVDLLVNNAGFGARGRFWELSGERQAAMMRLNVQAVVGLTHLLLPPMIAARIFYPE